MAQMLIDVALERPVITTTLLVFIGTCAFAAALISILILSWGDNERSKSNRTNRGF